ncbi:uncharacterized protein LOC132613029 [Lycium barbarum]|uniref:uncharacterized protein LOC132613029 n=1 Tax=Lycium barbarum TaxID=112863 RepID=UPI00293EA424|nr:uncharacterized protein LOC132613029 [Lycium barbarum]
MKCVTTVTYSITINGKASTPFHAKKGVSPLSPYLFVLAMEYLIRTLKTLHKQPRFHYHPKCKKQKIVQLSFADDLLMFCRGDKVSVMHFYACFQEFSMASGLIANVDKSCIYFGGVSTEVQSQILHELNFVKGDLPFRYLGAPSSTKRITIVQCKPLTIVQCKPLIDKILGRITSWISRFLSYAGRSQLIKSVLFAIQIFWSQIFAIPKKIIQVIESICKRFLWTGSVEVSKKALIAWETLCCPKSAGGLSILDVYTWNKAALAVWSKILIWQGIDRVCMNWQSEVEWALEHRKGKSSNAQVFKMTLAGSLYYIWQERNLRVFQNNARRAEVIVKQVIQDAHGRGALFTRMNRRLEESNMYP